MKKCISILALVLVVMAAMSCSLFSGAVQSPSPSPTPTPAPRQAEPQSAATETPNIPGRALLMTGDGRRTSGVEWTWVDKRFPTRDFTVVGIIVLRNVEMPSVDLMNAAKALNADDIMNVRIDFTRVRGKDTCLAASAVAIKYNTTPLPNRYYTAGGWNPEPDPAPRDPPILGTSVVEWSGYSEIPEKDYTVVGIVTVDSRATGTPSADLMDKAKEMGAHDIMNVRVDTIDNQIIGASAIAIRFTNVILQPPELPTLQDLKAMLDLINAFR